MKVSDNFFVLWDDDTTAKILREKFSADHVICSAEELKNAKLDSAEGIVILCELKWDENGIESQPSMFSGIEIAKHYLRATKRLRSPILFVSLLPHLFFEAHQKYMIINAIGHDFLQLETFQWDIWCDKFGNGKLYPLNNIQFSDIVTNMCSLRGLIGQITHNAKTKINKLEINAESDVESKINDVYQILDESLNEICFLMNNRPDTLRLRSEIIERFNKEIRFHKDFSGAMNFLRTYEEKLLRLDKETHNIVAPERVEHSWKALFLDDEPDSMSQILNELKKNGINVEICLNYTEAKRVIQEDEKSGNVITVVIADYRLFEQGTMQQQPKQGYDFLLWISRRDHFSGLVALSGLNTQFLLDTFRNFNVRVEVYAKDDLRSSVQARQDFAENIIRLGDENYQAVLSKPQTGKWNKELKPFYVTHRREADYGKAERQISEEARSYILHVKHILADVKNSNSLQFPGLSQIKIPSRVFKEIKDFRKLLLARRIAIWLLFYEGFDSNRVYAVLMHAKLDASYLENVQSGAKDLLNTRLCISKKKFPDDLLMEEIAWLKYYMRVNIYEMQTILLQVHEHFNEGFKHYPKLKEFMSEWRELENDFIEVEGKRELVLASVGDLKRVIRHMADKIKDVQRAKDASNMIMMCLQIISKDSNGAYVLKDIIEYLQKKLKILSNRS